MIRMCMSRLDQLTPFMILQKLEQEKNDLQKLLTCDPSVVKQNQSSVTKILNFVCLENRKYKVYHLSRLTSFMIIQSTIKSSESSTKSSRTRYQKAAKSRARVIRRGAPRPSPQPRRRPALRSRFMQWRTHDNSVVSTSNQPQRL